MAKPIMDCPQCGTPMNYIPAGISKKTKKPYKAFFSCPECNFTMNVPDDIASNLPKTPVKATSQYQERVERMHNEKTENINLVSSYKMANHLVANHPAFKDLKIAELRVAIRNEANWYYKELTQAKSKSNSEQPVDSVGIDDNLEELN